MVDPRIVIGLLYSTICIKTQLMVGPYGVLSTILSVIVVILGSVSNICPRKATWRAQKKLAHSDIL